ncbi:membrane protein [Liberibacter crescens]|nr:membrane protein [Liberibacter crescens]
MSDAVGKKVQLKAFIGLLLFIITVFCIVLFITKKPYLWIKALHIIAVMSWMSGLLYMPRIFVYHSSSKPGSLQYQTFEIMEERLLKIIMNPAMILSWIFGIYLTLHVSHINIGWLRIKFLLVLGLSAYHFYLAFIMKSFKYNMQNHKASYFRVINEIPTILMIVIVILTVVKPF